MRDFADKCGRTWCIDVTPRTVRRVREVAGLDLLDPAANPVARLTQDPVLLADVLLAMLPEQVAAARLSRDDFLDGLDLPALTRGRAAVFLATSDFLDLGALRADVTPAKVAGWVVQTMLAFDLALGNGAPLGVCEVPPPDALHSRLLDLMATLRAADPSEADALFDDVDAAEHQILTRRQRWRRRQWCAEPAAGT